MAEKSKLHLLKKLLETAENNIFSAKQLINEIEGKPTTENQLIREKAQHLEEIEKSRVIEGVFDGENMIGADKNIYPVPPNYASKSKLVAGDTLKLTIDKEGSFIFKQIEPVERKKIIGKLIEEEGDFRVLAEGKFYKVLLASITYFKAKPGDELTIILPKDKESNWAAIDNLVVH